MNYHPRKLRLLIIDDELISSFGGYQVPQSIEVVWLSENLPGIKDWRSALQFWGGFHPRDVPDLVLADVRFIDETSPLSTMFSRAESYLPTGLSHLKGFAVLSRALGRPIGVCPRTIDPRVWEDQIAAPKPDNQDRLENWILAKAMGYLAVHEIGELAAILRDGKTILGDTQDTRHHIRNCHEWLGENSETTFENGVGKAVRDYRRSLFELINAPGTPNIFVRPECHADLMGWCERMRKNPQPLDSRHDIGLELTYHNGNHDRISLASLFADYDRITTKALDPLSFATDGHPVATPWKLDHNGRPRIGAYLKELGSLGRACDKAAKALKDNYKYPVPENVNPPTLAAIKAAEGYSDLIAGLMVLFQFVRVEQEKVGDWNHMFKEYRWNPRKLHFVAENEPRESLQQALNGLLELIRDFLRLPPEKRSRRRGGVDLRNFSRALTANESGSNRADELAHLFTRVDLFVEFPSQWLGRRIKTDDDEHDAAWIRWHFERLVDAQVLRHIVDDEDGEEDGEEDGDDAYILNSAWRGNRLLTEPPPAPPSLPKIADTTKRQGQREPDRLQKLRVSLGYQENDYNSVARVLANAFGGLGTKSIPDAERVKIGGAIMEEFRAPDLRFFFWDLCRHYAKNHLDWALDEWPMWMRDRSDTVGE